MLFGISAKMQLPLRHHVSMVSTNHHPVLVDRVWVEVFVYLVADYGQKAPEAMH